MKSTHLILLLAAVSSIAGARPKTYDAAVSILGQADFTSEEYSDPSTSRSLYQVDGVAVDPTTGKLFVSDNGNSRVLRFSSTAAYQTFAEAEAVFGQPNFSENAPNQAGTPSAATLNFPANLCFDAAGNLWVADTGNARVLRYNAASAKPQFGATADGVIGQPDFFSQTPAMNSVADSGFISPSGVAVDAAGNLYVSDSGGIPRVLRFANAVAVTTSGDVAATSYLGKVDEGEFVPDTTNSAFSTNPSGLSVGPDGALWVADDSNHRVLRFDTPTVSGSAAGLVLGQPDFESNDIVEPPTGFSMENPNNVLIAPDGTLWVSDYSNYRVLGFLNVAGAVDGAAADIVLGQPNFTADTQPPYSARAVVSPTQIAVGREGSLFIGEYSFGAHLKRWSDPVTITAPVSVTTKKSLATIRGRSAGATSVTYTVAGQKGIKRAAGNTANWSLVARKLKKKKTNVFVTATAFDGRKAAARVSVTKKAKKKKR